MKEKKTKGIRSIYIFIPTIILIVVIQTVIIICTIMINSTSKKLSNEITRSNECNDEITLLLGGSSKLTDTATSFAFAPILPNGDLNSGPLIAYHTAITEDYKRPSEIRENLLNYNVSDDVLKIVDTVIETIEYLTNTQAHAFYLINEVKELKFNLGPNEINVLDDVVEYNLSTAELLFTDDEKLDEAIAILNTREYTEAKASVSSNVILATSTISANSKNVQQDLDFTLKILRGLLWASMTLILTLMIILFFILIKYLILPINGFTKKIDINEKLDSKKCIYEAKVLAIAYNKLLDRHKEFENDLRIVAEIDALTGLPNRYSYNNFLKQEINEDYRCCAFLLDINNLKYTNDTYGHAKGDELIRNASKCIKDCFLDEDEYNCYRIGGDEFVTIIKNIHEEDIEDFLRVFESKQIIYNVSIAIGYAYTSNIKEIGYEKLIAQADAEMYKNKNIMKEKESLNHKVA